MRRAMIIELVVISLGALAWAAPPSDAPGPATEQAAPVLSLTLVKHDLSQPLRALLDNPSQSKAIKISREHTMPAGINQLPDGWNGIRGVRHSPHVLQTSQGARATMPTPSVNVTGLGVGFPGYALGGVPPDTTGDVGPDHFIQWVNTSYAFFSKDGSVVDLSGSDFRLGNTLWSGFGGRCETTNDGDPIVIYDQLADRWVMTQFGLNSSGAGPHSQCLAVSTSSDPLGSWHRYEYVWPSNYLNDYPKLGVWPDGYYLAVNQFTCTAAWDCNTWRGAGVAVFERDQMLTGGSPQTAYWNLGTAYGSLLPADLDGDTLPPQGSPGYFFASSQSADAIQSWRVTMDWQTLANSTCGSGVNHAPNATQAVTSFAVTVSIDQPTTTNDLDSLSDRLMFRAAYRNFGDHESVVLCHTVRNPAAMRWYEIRSPGGTPVLYQEGTFTPDSNERWMGAVAMDRLGNIAMGYSVSGAAVSPSIRVTGRLAGAALGTMSFDEYEIQTGSGYQTPVGGQNRWGDYSTMSIDPEDDCTFWYTTEYTGSVGMYIWRTKIAAFAYPECIASLDTVFVDGFESAGTSAWSAAVP